MSKDLEFISRYMSLANLMTKLWNQMPAVVDDDFPACKHTFESTVQQFYDHIKLARGTERLMSNLREFQREQGKWSDETFGDREPKGPITHAQEELVEILDDPYNVVEYGDAMTLILDGARLAGFTVDDLFESMQTKFEINKQRTWGEPDENGKCKHIEEPTNAIT